MTIEFELSTYLLCKVDSKAVNIFELMAVDSVKTRNLTLRKEIGWVNFIIPHFVIDSPAQIQILDS